MTKRTAEKWIRRMAWTRYYDYGPRSDGPRLGWTIPERIVHAIQSDREEMAAPWFRELADALEKK